jgi:hypothetical protein
VAKEQKFCIFCGGSGLSKEHIWPEWGAELVPTILDPHNTTFHFQEGPIPIPKQTRMVKTRQGHTVTTKRRVVCRDCNHGWMATLEDDVRPIIVPMITGSKTTLTKYSMNTLLKWVVLKAIIIDQLFNHEGPIIRQFERTTFFQTREVPPWFQVWIGSHNCETWKHGIARSTIALKTLPGPDGRIDRSKNVQMITFGFGHLLMQIYTTTTNQGFYISVDTIGKLMPIWPQRPRMIHWPLPLLTDAQAYGLTTILSDYLKAAKVQWEP